MNQDLKRQICLLKNQTEIALALAITPQTVSLWLKSQVPSHRVIPLCSFLDWRITPHQIRRDIYPNPTDGIPVEPSPDAEILQWPDITTE